MDNVDGDIYKSVCLSASDTRGRHGLQAPTEGGASVRIAAFTTVYNESIFLPIWLKYYGRSLGAENLFVLDHGSTDGSTNGIEVTPTLRLPRIGRQDEDERAIFISRFQAVLLQYYDVVIFSDADEFLVPDPDHFSDLRAFIEQWHGDYVNAVGLNVTHVPDIEPSIDLSQPILRQRRYAEFSGPFCKPLISRIPLRWDAGMHKCDHAPAIDPRLFLFHLKLFDVSMLSKRQSGQPIVWSENAIRKHHGIQHRQEVDELISSTFSYVIQKVETKMAEGFDLSAELQDLIREWPAIDYFRRGTVVRIPSRFEDAIEGIGLPTSTAAAASPANRNISALRALRRLVFMEVLRSWYRVAEKQLAHLRRG